MGSKVMGLGGGILYLEPLKCNNTWASDRHGKRLMDKILKLVKISLKVTLLDAHFCWLGETWPLRTVVEVVNVTNSFQIGSEQSCQSDVLSWWNGLYSPCPTGYRFNACDVARVTEELNFKFDFILKATCGQWLLWSSPGRALNNRWWPNSEENRR